MKPSGSAARVGVGPSSGTQVKYLLQNGSDVREKHGLALLVQQAQTFEQLRDYGGHQLPGPLRIHRKVEDLRPLLRRGAGGSTAFVRRRGREAHGREVERTVR